MEKPDLASDYVFSGFSRVCVFDCEFWSGLVPGSVFFLVVLLAFLRVSVVRFAVASNSFSHSLE